MHIIVPMSGIGQRFINAGYQEPKPLVMVDGKPIIEHVISLFPGEDQFTFVCNSNHLKETNMKDVLTSLKPNANIVEIPNHKKGPVFAVLECQKWIEDEEEVIVNYCDFGTYWDYDDFLQHTRSRNADGAIPSYRGFHPHMLGTTNYAFMREDNQWMLEIKEKEPFTNNRMQEFASNGTYYFRKGSLVKKYFKELIDLDIHLNHEYYVSLVYNLLVRDQLRVSIYEIQHMLQWGIPEDVEEYNRWSRYFRNVLDYKASFAPRPHCLTLIPLAGKGSRFSAMGYKTPKPMLEVSGKPMILQAAASLPKTDANVFVVLQEHLDSFALREVLLSEYPKGTIVPLTEVTEGQAITCSLGLSNQEKSQSLFIAATDNGMLYQQKRLEELLQKERVDAIVFSFRNHPSSKLNPQMYGWLKVEEDNVVGVSVKTPISDQPEKDHAIVGTFYFRTIQIFQEALQSLIQNNVRVNGEFYVDSLIGELLSLGYQAKVFEVDDYIGWGTPEDYETFLYWQSFFHKADWHPYRLDKDPTVVPEKRKEMDKKIRTFSQKCK